MHRSNWANFLLAAALAISMASFVPQHAFAACKNAGGSVGAYKYSSEINGRSVTVCATALKVTPARTVVVKKKVISAASTLVKPKLSASYKQLIKRLGFVTPKKQPPKATQKIIKKQKPKVQLVQKVTKKKIKKPGSLKISNGATKFSPSAVSASVIPGHALKTGELGNFVASRVVQYKSGTVNNAPTTVRFTPVAVIWNFKDGDVAQGFSVFHYFANTGSYAVSYAVRFAVAYRVQGKKTWIKEPDFISMTRKLAMVISDIPKDAKSQASASPQPRKVLLVGSDCGAKPGSFGCRD
jgi:hypothetical protein